MNASNTLCSHSKSERTCTSCVCSGARTCNLKWWQNGQSRVPGKESVHLRNVLNDAKIIVKYKTRETVRGLTYEHPTPDAPECMDGLAATRAPPELGTTFCVLFDHSGFLNHFGRELPRLWDHDRRDSVLRLEQKGALTMRALQLTRRRWTKCKHERVLRWQGTRQRWLPEHVKSVSRKSRQTTQFVV